MKGAAALLLVVTLAGCGGREDELAVERAKLSAGRIELTLPEAASVEQVIVNDAFVDFRASRNVITLRYPWIAGESYDVELLTSDGRDGRLRDRRRGSCLSG